MKTDDKIGRVVDLLLTYRRENRLVLAALLGVSPKTLSRRISGSLGWTAEEVALMAEHFDVPVSAFYAGPDAMIARVRGQMSAHLTGASRPNVPSARAELVAA